MSVPIQGIKVILFDLGNVIINLHYDRTIRKIEALTGSSSAEVIEALTTAPLLQQFEVGAISEEVFREGFCTYLGVNLSIAEFNDLWNSMLGAISPDRIASMRALQKGYRTAILSNTNSIHEKAINAYLNDSHAGASLQTIVDKAFLSHIIGLRKPNSNCYRFVVAEMGVRPEEILFIDDRTDNIEAAASEGLRVFHNKHVDDWQLLF